MVALSGPSGAREGQANELAPFDSTFDLNIDCESKVPLAAPDFWCPPLFIVASRARMAEVASKLLLWGFRVPLQKGKGRS